jgi:hypothetical protein
MAVPALNRETGEVHVLSNEDLRIAEGETDVSDVRHDCEEEEIELAQLILDSDRYLALPSSYGVHEWRIMDAFCHSIGDEGTRTEFLGSIRGRGAFRYFKDLLLRHGLLDSWFAFRGEALKKIAIEWCEEHEIPFQA